MKPSVAAIVITAVVGGVWRLPARAADADSSPATASVPASQPDKALQSPTTVSLQLDNADPRSAIAALRKAAPKLVIESPSDQALAAIADRRVTVNFKDLPFIQAAGEVARQAGMDLQLRAAGGMTTIVQFAAPHRPAHLREMSIIPVPEPGSWALAPTAQAGPFTVSLTAVTRSALINLRPDTKGFTAVSKQLEQPAGSRTFELSIRTDPLASVVGLSAPIVTDVQDRDGESLLISSNQPPHRPATPGASSFSSASAVIAPQAYGERVTVHGNYIVHLPEDVDLIELDNIQAVNDLTERIGDFEVVFVSLLSDAGTHRLTIAMAPGAANPEARSAVQRLLQYPGTAPALLDQKGRLFQFGGTQVNPARSSFVIQYSSTGEDATPPARLKWSVPVQVKEVIVPFTIENVLIP